MYIVDYLRQEKKFLITLFCVSLFIRLFWFFVLLSKGGNCWVLPDSAQYVDCAHQLIGGYGFTLPDGQLQYYRLPGYPVFLSLLFACCGTLAYNAVLVIQIIIASIIPLLLSVFSRVVYDSLPLARFIGLLGALHVGFILYSGMFMTESLFMIFFLLFLIAFLGKYFPGRVPSSHKASTGQGGRACLAIARRATAETAHQYYLAGFFLGIVSLIRPVGHYVLIVSILILLIFGARNVREGAGGNGPQYCVISFSLAWLCVVTPWLLRNFLTAGALFFHTLPGHHFLQYSAAYVVMDAEQCSYAQVRPRLLAQWDEAIAVAEKDCGHKLNDYQRCCIAESLAKTIIKQHPVIFCTTALGQIVRTCCGLYTAQPLLTDGVAWPGYTPQTTWLSKIKRFLFPSVHHPILIFLIYAEMLLMLFYLFGLLFFLIFAMRDIAVRRLFFLFMPFVALFIIITLGYGCARLRMPAEPFILFFSAMGWLYVWRRRRGCDA